jgi:hypothetical protein
MERKFEGIWIPRELWQTKELTLIEKCFLCEINSLDNEEGCYASNSHFSDWSGLTTQRCSQIIKSLEEKKYISVRYEREGKSVKRRVVNILDRVSNIFSGGIKFFHGGYQENFKGRLTIEINKENNNNTAIDSKQWFSTVPKEGLENFSWHHFTRNYNATNGKRTRWEDVLAAGERFRDLQMAEGSRKIYKEWCKHFQNWLKFQNLPNSNRVSL